MALQTFWKQMYADLIRQLVGTQTRSILKEFCVRDTKKGEAQLFDAVAPLDEADETAIGSIDTSRKYFDTLTNPDLADFLKLLTPHKEITRQRTQAIPVQIETGHVFRSEDEIAENANLNSRVLQQLLRTIYKKEDARILGVLRAATQTRASTDGKTFGSVSFPAGQILGAGGEITAYTKSVPTLIRQIFETNFAGEQKILCAISPLTKAELIEQSGDKIQNKDFVDSASYFANGSLPDIQGVVHIVHPAVEDDEFLAWVPDAIMYNECAGLTTKMGEDPGQRFRVNLYLEEFVSNCRLDDKLVVQGQITRGT